MATMFTPSVLPKHPELQVGDFEMKSAEASPIRRTSSGKAKNGITNSELRRQL